MLGGIYDPGGHKRRALSYRPRLSFASCGVGWVEGVQAMMAEMTWEYQRGDFAYYLALVERVEGSL